MRRILPVLLGSLVFQLLSFGALSASATGQTSLSGKTIIKIGYLSQKRSLTYLPSMKPNYMKAGYQLAFKDFNNSKWAKDHNVCVELVEFDVGTKDLDLIKAFRRAVDSDVLAVVGLDTSKEALLVAKLAQKSRLLTLSASAAHDAIGQVGDYVYSGSNPISSTVMAMGSFIKKNNMRRILIISNYDEPYSKKYADSLLNGGFIKERDVTHVSLSEGRKLNEQHLQKINAKKYDVVIITTYSYSGAIILDDLMDHSVVTNQRVLVPQVWYFDAETVKKYLKRPCKIVCMAAWYNTWQDKVARQFYWRYKEEYSSDPLTDDAHTYDMANILLSAIINGDYSTREKLKDSFKKIKHYRGATGWFHYDECSGHPRKNYFVLQMNRSKDYDLLQVYTREKNPNCK